MGTEFEHLIRRGMAELLASRLDRAELRTLEAMLSEDAECPQIVGLHEEIARVIMEQDEDSILFT